jgi:DNA-binding transcriptional ArsR family regulator
MAGRQHYKSADGQLPLDFESTARERHAMLISALTLTGTLKQAALARLVLWCHETHGDALGMTKSEIGRRLGVSTRTVRYWMGRLGEAGILAVMERRFRAGGQSSNLLSIDWQGVRKLTVDRGAILADRGAKIAPRGAKIAPPIRNNLPSSLPRRANNTNTTTTPTCKAPDGAVWEEVVVEIALCGVGQAAKALASVAHCGGSPGEARSIVALWHELRTRWPEPHQPVVLYRRLCSWRPGQNPRDGWPPASDSASTRLAAAKRVGPW